MVEFLHVLLVHVATNWKLRTGFRCVPEQTLSASLKKEEKSVQITLLCVLLQSERGRCLPQQLLTCGRRKQIAVNV